MEGKNGRPHPKGVTALRFTFGERLREPGPLARTEGIANDARRMMKTAKRALFL